MNLLTAIPYRHDTNPHFVKTAEKLARRLPGDYVLWANDMSHIKGGKYAKNAAARNEFIERFLDDNHDYVFWMDVDIVDYPADIIERLQPAQDRIVAAVTYVEKLQNGGWFYDTGGFVRDGKTTHMHTGIENPEGLEFVPMDSVGCCAVVPAWLYRKGCHYAPELDDVEHVSFCTQARALGVQAYAAVNVRCLHALLPLYGLEWH